MHHAQCLRPLLFFHRALPIQLRQLTHIGKHMENLAVPQAQLEPINTQLLAVQLRQLTHIGKHMENLKVPQAQLERINTQLLAILPR
jgi:hypothetical protein